MIKHVAIGGKRPAFAKPQKIAVIFLVILVVCAAVIGPLLVRTLSSGFILGDLQNYVAGQLGTRDVIAPQSVRYEDRDATRRAVTAAEAAVPPYFVRSLRSTLVARGQVDGFTAGVLSENADASARAFMLANGIIDTQGIVDRFMRLSQADRTIMASILKETASFLLETGLYDGNELSRLENQGITVVALREGNSSVTSFPVGELITMEDIQSVTTPFLEQYGDLPAFDRWLLLDSLSLLLVPNVHYDEVTTIGFRQLAADSVSPVMAEIAEGEYIIRRNEVVTGEMLDKLDVMRGEKPTYSFAAISGMVLFSVIVTSGGVIMFDRFPNRYRRFQFLLILLIGIFLTLIAMVGVMKASFIFRAITMIPFLPILFLPIFISLVTNDKRLGLIAAAMLCAYAVLFMEGGRATTYVELILMTCSCVYAIQFASRRLDMLYQVFLVALIGAFIVTLFSLIDGYRLTAVPLLVIGIVGNVVISYLLAIILLPIMEKLFNIPTAFMLHELSYTDSPTLIRLSQVAQGTYNHSRVVADLAYDAARAIGANALLVRAAALYHDIGKADHPEYFIENQTGENKHDDLKPSLFAAIIKSHVRLGVEKGREIGLPQEVLQIISEHHGNDVIYYFYKEAQQDGIRENRLVAEEDFCYSGNPPGNQESAIVMLSDCVEAATRSIKRPTTPKYEKMIHQIIMGKIERDQLNDSHLSLSDLDIISSSLLHTLIGRDHRRIEYPEDIPAGQQQLFSLQHDGAAAGQNPSKGTEK
ncbi:HD family phosphohydrolase [Parasphaerochaeta coccoides]|uniref:Metal dependent phosphohydrolase n=1 Tax=Parasphaerochaeta coccoides (strain ATCC BAA-1237 / DSM 17374 / SPN1) TaxID=760011 RepID=F4GII8_PARC1|nr:HDIG domain-containing metalloprotein [Parasphaerochaeta coccoides]AEC01696.1 metal dependent phosphohydrolase [Parasphaerochaeta coccoides DSM 17374]